MSSAKKTNPRFTFTHADKARLGRGRWLLLWALRVPANAILFSGLTGALGIGSVLVAQLLITPKETPGPPPLVIIPGSEPTAIGTTALFLIVGLLVLAFWIGAAYFTHRAVLWLARVLNLSNYLLALRISLLSVGWLPLAAIFAVHNTSYSGEILGVSGALIFFASLLFFIEHLLESYWKQTS